MADIDTLSIKIEANADGAKKGVNGLAKALERLDKAIAVLDIGKINDFCNAVNNLAGAADALANSADAVKVLARAYKELDKSGYSVKRAQEATDSLANSTDGLSNASSSMNELAVAGNALVSIFERITSVAGGLKEYEAVSQSFERISGASQKLIGEMNVFDTTFREITEPINQIVVAGNTVVTIFERMAEVFSGLNEYASGVAGAFAALGGGSQRLIEDMGIIDTTFREINEPADEATESVNNFANAVEDAAKGAAEAGEEIKGKAAKGFESIISPAKAAKITVKSLESGFKGFASTLKSAGLAFAVFAKKSATTVTGLKGFKGLTDKVKNSAKSLAKEFGRVAKMLKLMVTRMILRQAISNVTDGFKNLAQYSKQFDATLSLLWNDFRQLGNSIAAAASPLLNVFAPAIHTIIQLVIQAVNAINQLLSALTGLASFTRAKKLSDSYAASLDKSNKSAKALKKTVLGFDELNQLQDHNKGGGGTSPANMFEEAPIDDKWKDWAAKLKKMWEMGDFTELGKDLGKKLLDALEKIPWNKIKARAYKLGKSFATLLNGIIETPKLARTLGKSIAETINTAVMLANGFVRNFHWDSFGKFIGEMFNGFFENIDWYYIKDTVVTGLRGLASTIQNFIKTFNWDNISKTIVNALDTISAGVYAFFKGIDWKDLGERVGGQITKTIKETDWRQIGKAIGSIIQAAIDFAANTLKQLHWQDIVIALYKLISGFFEEVDPNAIGKIVKTVLWVAIGKGVLSLAATGLSLAAKTALTEGVKKLLASVFGSKAAETAVSESLSGAVTAGAKGATVNTAATTAGTGIGTVLGGAIAAATAGILGQQLGNEIFYYFNPDETELYQRYQGIQGFFQELADIGTSTAYLVKEAWSGELSETNFYMSLSREEQNYFSALKAHYGQDFPAYMQMNIDLFGSYEKAWVDLKDEAKGYYDEVQSKLSGLNADAGKVKETMNHIYDSKAAEGWRDMTQRAGELKESLNHIADTKAAEGLKRMRESAGFKEIADNAKNLETTLSNTQKTVNDATTSIGEDWKGTQEEVSTAVTTMSTDISDGMTTIQTTVSDSMTEITASFDTIKEGMTKDKWTFDGVAEGLGETFHKAKEAIKREWNEIANTLNGNHTVGTSSININLPKFANGGFPRENGLFMANSTEMVGKFSNGKTAVANNEQITDGIARAVFNAMTSAQANGGSQYINNTIMVDGDVIARAVTKGQERLNRRYSPAMG